MQLQPFALRLSSTARSCASWQACASSTTARDTGDTELAYVIVRYKGSLAFRKSKTNVQHSAFPCGPPPQYYPSSMPSSIQLNFAVRMGNAVTLDDVAAHDERVPPRRASIVEG